MKKREEKTRVNRNVKKKDIFNTSKMWNKRDEAKIRNQIRSKKREGKHGKRISKTKKGKEEREELRDRVKSDKQENTETKYAIEERRKQGNQTQRSGVKDEEATV